MCDRGVPPGADGQTLTSPCWGGRYACVSCSTTRASRCLTEFQGARAADDAYIHRLTRDQYHRGRSPRKNDQPGGPGERVSGPAWPFRWAGPLSPTVVHRPAPPGVRTMRSTQPLSQRAAHHHRLGRPAGSPDLVTCPGDRLRRGPFALDRRGARTAPCEGKQRAVDTSRRGC